MPGEANETPNLLSPGEVAQLFRVDPKTVTRWAKAGKLSPVKTLGGHRRYHAHEVHELLRKIQDKYEITFNALMLFSGKWRIV